MNSNKTKKGTNDVYFWCIDDVFFMVFIFWVGASCIENKNHSDDIKVAGRHFDKMTKQAISNARKKGFKV
ncbi:hypothetical protein WHV88_19495 [Enterobacter hormaechei]|uniref:hypothetical protein n=1 Tax=Enterobacter hormaechei TaxID=158836 RepID=UPI000A9FD919|nr:hypothetical protein [Enterobacter hormaechei]MCK2094275.1 hypothetical protein [Enterobacter hormaechei]